MESSGIPGRGALRRGAPRRRLVAIRDPQFGPARCSPTTVTGTAATHSVTLAGSDPTTKGGPHVAVIALLAGWCPPREARTAGALGGRDGRAIDRRAHQCRDASAAPERAGGSGRPD